MIRQGADTLQVFHIVLFIIFATADNADAGPDGICEGVVALMCGNLFFY